MAKISQKEWLQSHLNPSKPPKPKELKSWKAIIQKLELNGLTDLYEIGKSLAHQHAGDTSISFEESLETDFQQTELAIGLLSKEAKFNFKSGHETISTAYEKESNFDIGKMAPLLDCNQAELIRKVKEVISQPDFAY